MDCPKCLGILERKILLGVEVDVCPMCEGIWFDKGELFEIIKADLRSGDVDGLFREDIDGKEVQGSYDVLNEKLAFCPRCEERGEKVEMKRSLDKKNGIWLDSCPVCGGIWLDGGELAKIRPVKKKIFISVLKNLDFIFSAVGRKMGFRRRQRGRNGEGFRNR